MTGRELVRRAIKFQGPERVPYNLPAPYGSDFFSVGIGPDPSWKASVQGEDEWGSVWQKLPGDKTMGQVKTHPLDDYAKLDTFRFPNYDLPVRYEAAKKAVPNNKDGKFVLAGIPLSLIHRLEYLRGHVEAWTDPYDHPEELGRLLDKMADIAIRAIRHLAEVGVDGIISCDDWGLQDRPMIPPRLFRQFFKPRYARVYGEAHKHGMLTLLHSCGHIADLLDDLIEAELDVIQMDQQENMGMENLARRFGGRLAFWCPVDIQQTMVRGSIDDVRHYARRLMWTLGNFNGGFIAQWYASPAAVNHSQEKINAMSETFVKYGKYPLAQP